MSFSSYIVCGLQSASWCSDDEDSDSSSHFSIMDYFQDFPLCGQTNIEAVETIFRPPLHTEDSDREGITHGNKIMEKPWRPPRYRDTSLLAAPLDTEEESQPSSSSQKTIAPSIGVVSCDDSIPSRSVVKNDDDVSLPPAFIPPKNHFRKSRQGQNDENSLSLSYSKRQASTSSTTNMKLERNDVVCGRGAPSSIHYGNLAFKKSIKKHEMTYLCSTRSEKPKIAMKLLKEFRDEGIRFVKRERNIQDGGFVWVDIGEQRSYEKICQSLREGAPQLRRQMMATEAKRMKSTKDEKKEHPIPNGHHYQQTKQQRQDSDTDFSGETKRIVCHVSRPDASSLSTVRTMNVNRYNPIGQQNHHNIEWMYYQYHDSKDHLYDVGKHYDVPYYVHLPPHLGGEKLFRDRI